MACPVGINTGKMVKQLRMENHSRGSRFVAIMVASNFKNVEAIIGFGLRAGSSVNGIFGKNIMKNLTSSLHRISNSFPIWTSQLTKPPRGKYQYPQNPEVLYFPACITRMMGDDIERKDSQLEIFMKLSAKAGIAVLFPEEVKGLCCGQAFSSKGYKQAYLITVEKTIRSLHHLSKNGSFPVVMDITSCTNTILNCREDLSEEVKNMFDALVFLDVIDYLNDWILPRVIISRKMANIALHPVCALSKNESQFLKFKNIAATCSENYFIAPSAGCCGTAGDRGFFYPELTGAATSRESNEIRESEFDGYYSTAKTCEMSMSEATGRNYRSILYLLEDVIS